MAITICFLSIQPFVKAISSKQAIFNPCLSSKVETKDDAL